MPKTYDFTRKQLLLWRSYFANLLLFFPAPFLICLLLFIYIFIQLVLFCLLAGSFSILLQMCSSQGCSANSLPHSHIICRHGLAAFRKQCLHQKRKPPFVHIWLVLSAGSFRLCLTVFTTCLPIRFMLRPTYSA